MRCIFVVVLFKICLGRLPQKSRFFAVTIKTNRKNDQVQDIVDSTLFYNVSPDHTSLIFQFLRQSCLSTREMGVFCDTIAIPVTTYREWGGGRGANREYM